MAFEATNLRLFGLDFGRVANAVRQGWDGVLRWHALAWFSPVEAVEVVWPDGSVRACAGPALDATDGSTPYPRFKALLLPDDIVLSHQMRLPHLANAEIEDALKLQLHSLSPFSVDGLAWGWRADKIDDLGLLITLAFASRSHIEAFLFKHGMDADSPGAEVWANIGGGVVLRGFGEPRREKAQRDKRRKLLLLVGLAVVLAVVFASTHFMQLRARVFDAQAQFATLQAEATPFIEARNGLVQSVEKARSIGEFLETQPDLPWLLESLTELLPDSAWLSRLDVDGRRVRVTGQATDAAALMETLRAYPEFSELRALSPITRGRDGRDSFSLEFQIAVSGGR